MSRYSVENKTDTYLHCNISAVMWSRPGKTAKQEGLTMPSMYQQLQEREEPGRCRVMLELTHKLPVAPTRHTTTSAHHKSKGFGNPTRECF